MALLAAHHRAGRTVRKQARDKLAAAFRIQLGDDVAADNCADELPSGGDTTGSDPDHTSEGKVTDPDARFMKTSDGGKRPCYNSQIVENFEKGKSGVFIDVHCAQSKETCCPWEQVISNLMRRK